jgi:hypothetical protein
MMARGWESKSVEEQQGAVAESAKPAKAPMTAEQIAKQKRRDGLNLSRKRVLNQLQNAHNPSHRKMLEQALADLDIELKNLS